MQICSPNSLHAPSYISRPYPEHSFSPLVDRDSFPTQPASPPPLLDPYPITLRRYDIFLNSRHAPPLPYAIVCVNVALSNPVPWTNLPSDRRKPPFPDLALRATRTTSVAIYLGKFYCHFVLFKL